MTHGFSDQSGKPVKTTRIDGREIRYDTRKDEIAAEYGDETVRYQVEDRDVDIPRYGAPVILDGEEFPDWDELRGELE